jgi:glutathione-regulated potassium-efflux system protein KefB
MTPTDHFGFLLLALILLAAAVVSVPLARWLRLSAVVAYLAAGVAIGPFGLGLFSSPDTILTVADLGVVMLLFLVGLELEIGRLLAMRRAIFGLGAAQVLITSTVLGACLLAARLTTLEGAIVGGLALAMSATSIALQILDQRGELQQSYGQRAFAVLLFQDMSVVPLLALLPLLAPGGGTHPNNYAATLLSVGEIVAAIAVIIIAGRYLLNPFFKLLASTGARETMTAAALLIVLGAAALMQAVGMSMALGAFLAGVMLAESNYRHELEADIEPFRGLLLALFFMGIGMSIDLLTVRDHLVIVIGAAIAVTIVKAAVVGVLFRLTKSPRRDAAQAASILTAAGEFAFVLIPVGAALSILTVREAALLTAIAAITMLLGPPTATITDWLLKRTSRTAEREAESFDGAHGSVLIIGFGRFGQIVSQCLVTEGLDVIIIDNDPEMIESAARFGFKVYFGDGTRLDVLRASRAVEVRLIAVCVDDVAAANRIVDLVREDLPGTQLYVRSYDRRHTLELIGKGVDFELRETFESAVMFGQRTLEALGANEEHAAEVAQMVRERDRERLVLQQAEGLTAGAAMMRQRYVRPEPFSRPRREAEPLNPEAGSIIEKDRVDASS